MQLLHLSLPHFRNLRNVEFKFKTELEPLSAAGADGPRKRIRSHALIGPNGVGKSNLIEALIIIFRDIDLDRDVAFPYTLAYAIRGHTVEIEGEPLTQKRPFVKVDGVARSQRHLIENRELLPSHIFAYYSGATSASRPCSRSTSAASTAARRSSPTRFCRPSCCAASRPARPTSAPSRRPESAP